MTAHDWCDTMFYCRKCGMAQASFFNDKRPCTTADNVVGISHWVRRRSFGLKLGMNLNEGKQE